MFRILITHDIDHVGLKDHYLDLGFPKFAVLNLIGLAKRTLSVREFFLILSEMAKSATVRGYDTWSCVDQWIELEAAHSVRSTWFVACRRGRSLFYTPSRAAPVVRRLKEEGYEVGLHSQSKDAPEGIPAELEAFRHAYGIEGKVPLRMHYLANRLEDIAQHKELFSFDSSLFDETAFSSADDFEKPINIMDTYFFSPLGKVYSLREAQEKTNGIVEAARTQARTLVVDFHQRSLSKTLPRYREYILWFYRQLGGWK